MEQIELRCRILYHLIDEHLLPARFRAPFVELRDKVAPRVSPSECTEAFLSLIAEKFVDGDYKLNKTFAGESYMFNIRCVTTHGYAFVEQHCRRHYPKQGEHHEGQA